LLLRFAALGVSLLPLWGQHDTQVANAQALATIRIFSNFSIDIHTYHLYNCPRYGKERMEGCGKEERGTPLNCRSHIAHCEWPASSSEIGNSLAFFAFLGGNCFSCPPDEPARAGCARTLDSSCFEIF
jgi:hypothetical protein